MIYIASPYTHKNPAIMQQRYQMALRYTMLCQRRGEVVFSPIAYGHQFALKDSAFVPFTIWEDFNQHILLASDELRILELSGWRNSKGIEAEVQFADRS